MNPREFKGSADPIDAKIWSNEMEMFFALVKARDNQTTESASYFLKHETYYWWESVYAMEGKREVSWDRFKELLEKYFPHYMQDQMEIIFLERKQGNGTVEEYEAKFTELARLVRAYVSTQRQKGKEVTFSCFMKLTHI